MVVVRQVIPKALIRVADAIVLVECDRVIHEPGGVHAQLLAGSVRMAGLDWKCGNFYAAVGSVARVIVSE